MRYAGTKPGMSLNPQAVDALTEFRIDISGELPKLRGGSFRPARFPVGLAVRFSLISPHVLIALSSLGYAGGMPSFKLDGETYEYLRADPGRDSEYARLRAFGNYPRVLATLPLADGSTVDD